MQHKSLFAALLCGALCLTACLKNEESPSVTQVRNAKAEQLLSEATLNKANAEATLLLAKADVKIKEAQAAYLEADAKYRAAEAEIRKADAAKVLAEAELLKVQADIAKADLKLKEHELKQKEEELKAQIAEYEARIAAANAEKMFWEAQMQLMEKELEAALTEAEAALWDAKLSLFESEKAYNDAIAEAEAAATEANKQAVEDLRALVADLNARYHAAALELLDLQFEIAETQKMIAGLEADILDASDVKRAQIEANNKDIARLTIVLNAIKDAEGKTTEELLDEAANLTAELIAQVRKVYDAATAYDAAEDAFLESIPNQVGVEADDPYYAVTYTYTQDFYVRSADQKELAHLPVSDYATGQIDDYYWHIDDNNNHHEAYLVEELDPETGLTSLIFRDEIWALGYDDFWGSYMDEIIEVQDTPLYTYCDGTYEWGVKYNGLVRYPEIGEGISYDRRAPYMTYEDVEYIPLDINREGYEKYVFFINQMAESVRDEEIEWLDYYISSDEEEIALRQELIDYIAPVFDKMEKKFAEAEEDFDKMYEDVVKLYNEYQELAADYYQTYVVEGLVEVTDAWWVYQEAQEVYDEAVAARDEYVAANKAYIKYLQKRIANAQATIEYETAYMKSNNYTFEQTMVEYYEGVMEQAKYDLEQATTPYNAAKKALEDQQKLVNDKYKAYYDAQLAYYEAWSDWQAIEGGTGPQPQAVTDAQNAMNDAWTEYYTENGKIAGLEADYSSKQSTYNTRLNNYNDALADYESAVETVESHQKKIDKAQAVIDENTAIIKDYNDTLDDLNDAIDAALLDVQAAIADWSTEAGTDAAKAMNDAYDAFNTAYLALSDPANNPVIQLLIKYGVILNTEDIDYYDFSEVASSDLDWLHWVIFNYPEYFDEMLVDEYFGYEFNNLGGYWQDLSPVAVYVITLQYEEEIAELNEEIEGYEAQKEVVRAACEAQIEENNKYLTELDEVLANEEVYFAGIAKTNELYAAYVEAEKVYFDETVKLMEIQGKLAADEVLYNQAEAIEGAIAALEAQIAALEEENADWAAIEDATVAVNKLKETLKLTQSKAEVDEVLVESLKAELDEAVAALKATIAE